MVSAWLSMLTPFRGWIPPTRSALQAGWKRMTSWIPGYSWQRADAPDMATAATSVSHPVTACWCSWHGYCRHRVAHWSSVNAQEWSSLYQDHCLQFPDFLIYFLGCHSRLIFLPQLLLVHHWLSHDQRVVLCFLLFQLSLDCAMVNKVWGRKSYV